MLQTFTKKIIRLLTDWLIAFVAVIIILWFGFTLPIFTSSIASLNLPFSNSTQNFQKTQVLSISQNNLKGHVETLSNYYAPRTVEFGNLNATAGYIHDEFKKYGKTHYQPYWTLISNYKNVILELGPKTKEVFVIGAHYDAKDDSLDSDGNASGISALIELAHQLSKNEDKLSIGVQLVAYPLSQRKSVVTEEMGSTKHARWLYESGKSVKLMLSLDGVGRYSDNDQSQKYPHEFLSYFYPDKGNYIGLVASLQDYSQIMDIKKSFKHASTLPLYSFSMPESYYPTNSQDHLNYQRYGFSAMAITDTSEHRKIDDKAETVADQMDYEKIALLVQGLYQVVMDNKSELQSPDVELVQRGIDNTLF